MKLESVTVRHVTRFAGPVTLDLRALPEGLVAVVGPNGEGKTTILEAGLAAITREFPSRADKDLVDYATERDAFIEAVYAVDTVGTYRARVNLDGLKRNADAVLELTAPDGRTTVLNDGKVSTFDQATARVFPPRDVLLASAFSAQNRAGSFVSLDKRGRKELFARLLGLERLDAMAATAREAAGICEQARTHLRGRREVIAREAEATTLAAIEADLALVTSQRTDAEAARARWTALLDQLQRERAEVAEAAQRHAAAAVRVAGLEQQAATVRATFAPLAKRAADAEAAFTRESAAADAELQKAHADIEERIRNNQGVIDAADAIRAAAADLARCHADIARHEAALVAINADIDAIEARHREANAGARRLGDARGALKRARDGAALLGQVPCGGAGTYAACGFLTNAQELAALIPANEQAVADLDACEAAIAAADADRRAAVQRRTEATRAKQARQEAARALEPKAKLLPNIETAEARINELWADRSRAERARAVAVDAAAARRAAALAAIADEQTAAEAHADELAAALAEARDEAAHTAGAAAAIVDLDRRLEDARAQSEAVATALAMLTMKAEAIAERQAAYAAAVADLADVDGRLHRIENELLEWQFIAKALSKDGLPTLEIDAAGPTVSAYCNDLLAVCFGPRFTVELVTQVAKADGKGVKEAFDLKVYDNLRGGEPRDLGDLSGGEMVLVDEALKNALALFVNARNVSQIRTCWRDETTGPLDAENAARYLDMLRRVRAIGGFHQILFVTHNRDAANGADAQVRVAGGGITTARPPFAEAA